MAWAMRPTSSWRFWQGTEMVWSRAASAVMVAVSAVSADDDAAGEQPGCPGNDGADEAEQNGGKTQGVAGNIRQMGRPVDRLGNGAVPDEERGHCARYVIAAEIRQFRVGRVAAPGGEDLIIEPSVVAEISRA